MKIDQIQMLAAEGVLGSPIIRRNFTGFFLTFQRLSGQGVGIDLMTARGHVRSFKTIDAAANVLLEIGFTSSTIRL